MKSIAYEAVSKQIMEAMDKGEIPWKRSWTSSMPQNAVTGRKYNGINFFLLSWTEYTDNRWLTYKQATTLGGTVKKGEKARQVVFWQILSKEEDGKKKSIPLLKYYNVFNVAQIEGIEWPERKEVVENVDAETLLVNYTVGPKVTFGGSQPCYIPSMDTINIPSIEEFDSPEEYYSTRFHEEGHGTGHGTRLDRKLSTDFGSEKYSCEELVAEMTAAFLCSACGIDNTIENSAAYIKGWSLKLKAEPSIIVTAASRAQKAADYILTNGGTEVEEVTEEETLVPTTLAATV